MKTLPRVERAGAKLATAFQVVFDTTAEQVDTDTGEISPPKVETLTAMWGQIEAVVPRHEPAAAIAALFELTPPLDSDADQAWRAMLVTRFGTARPFLKLLVKVVDFGATPEGAPVPAALKTLPEPMGRKSGTCRDRHRAAGRVLAAPGAGRAEPGAGDSGLEGVRVLRVGTVPPHAAPAGDLRMGAGQAHRPSSAAPMH
jgi:hypothetical protein